MHLMKVIEWFNGNGYHTSHCSIAPHFPCRDSTTNLAVCTQFESHPQHIWYDVNYMGLLGSVKSTSDLTYTFKERHETLHQQYMSLIVAYYLFPPVERVLQTWHFVYTLRNNIIKLNSHLVTHKWRVSAFRSSPNLSYTSKEAVEPHR